jgi:NAD(P)-dependent dehydrogenase (short-subunit alcohol dehydrogenase family)
MVAQGTGDSFEGQVALVTGGGGGIGGAVARALLERGATVICADRAAPLTPEGAGGERFHAAVLDVTRCGEVQRLVRSVAQAQGRIDLLVNVAGVVSHGSAESISEEEWDRVLDINLKGTFFCCQAVIEPMRRRKYGRIVNIGSVVGKNAGNARPWLAPQEQAVAGNAAYGASKAGVHAITGFLAKELARDGITVNAVAPGPIATAMTKAFPEALRTLIPVGRMGSLEDVVRAVLFLGSRDSGFINGEVLDVNGGMWCD